MAALAATNSATPSLPRTLILSRLEAARREADVAQANVQNLRAQVDAAEAESQNRQDKVRSLANQASQTDPTYGTRVQTGASALPVKPLQFRAELNEAGITESLAIRNGFKSKPGAAPVFNIQGLTAGRIVSINA